jgi:16S rRNA C967 or C1407 C5-methylase (RsmB/RsmF family)
MALSDDSRSSWASGLAKLGLSQDELQQLHQALDQYAPRCIRRHPRHMQWPLPFVTQVLDWFDRGCVVVDGQIRPSQFLEYAAGDYYIQDAGSMLAVALLDAQPDEWICDLCAAPGGKASAVLETLGPRGWLIANEPIHSRVEVLRFNLERTGMPWYAVTSLDPDRLASVFSHKLDAVLVDAPCTGQALVAHDKRSENAFALPQIEHSVRRQQRILEAAVRMIRPGGRIVYSTCTFSTAENEDQIAWLMHQYPGCFEPIVSDKLEPWASPILPGCYRVWPHRHPTAGAFAAGVRLVQALPDAESNETANNRASHRTKKNKSFKLDAEAFLETEVIEQHFGKLADASTLLYPWHRNQDRTVDRLDPSHFGWPKYVDQQGKQAQPEHALAVLGKAFFTPHESVQVDAQEAKAYMSGAIIARRADTSSFQQVVWRDSPLGWCKVNNVRANNCLPKIARLDIS